MERSKRAMHKSSGAVAAAAAEPDYRSGSPAELGLAVLDFLSPIDVRECVLLLLSYVELCRLRAVSRDFRTWGDLLLAHIGTVIRLVDVAVRVPLLRRFAGTAGARVVLLPATYELTVADGGRLEIAAGVTLVGQEGVVLSGDDLTNVILVVKSEGVSFVSMHLPRGVLILGGTMPCSDRRTIPSGSLTMTKCTSTGGKIYVAHGAKLDMEDTRIYGVLNSYGLECRGDVKAKRCTIEENRDNGVWIGGEHASGELVDCVIHKNRGIGVYVSEAKVMLRGGTVSENKGGVFAQMRGGKVTVAKAEKDKPQTVSKDSYFEWGTIDGGEIIGIPQEKISVWS